MLKRFNFKQSGNQLEGYAAGGPSPHVPDALCMKCPGCNQMVFSAELRNNDWLCPSCGHHFSMSARQRIGAVCDPESFEEWDKGMYSKDPLNFPGYEVKLKSSRISSRENEGVVTGRAG